jgi:hypothetical protein
MVALVVGTAESAFDLFKAAISGELDTSNIDGIEFGDWVNPRIHLPTGHSEITPPFMEAFVTSQTAIYRLVAEIKYGDGDVRHLTPDDLEAFQVKVQVTDGSSNFKEEIGKALENIGMKAVDKLSPNQIIGIVLGLALLTSGTMGFSTYLEHRKSVRVEELHSVERQQAMSTLQFANKEQADTARAVIDILKQQGGVSARAVQTAADSNAAKLKAATTVPEVEVSGIHLTQGEAKELRATARRRSNRMIVEREMRVIQINTSEEARTTVAVEEVGTGNQYRVTFGDLLIEDRDLEKLFESLRNRDNIWLRLDVKEVGGEIRTVEIRGVVEAPPDGTQTATR